MDADLCVCGHDAESHGVLGRCFSCEALHTEHRHPFIAKGASVRSATMGRGPTGKLLQSDYFDAWGTLEITPDEPDRMSLLGRPVHCGEAIEIHLADGTWLAGRYEVEHRRASVGGTHVIHMFYFSCPRLAGDSSGDARGACFPIPNYAELRWPR